MLNMLQSQMTARLTASSWNWGVRRNNRGLEERASNKVRLIPNPSIDTGVQQAREEAYSKYQQEREMLEKKIADQQMDINMLNARLKELERSSEAARNALAGRTTAEASRIVRERLNNTQLKFDKMRHELDVSTIFNYRVGKAK